MEEGVLVAELRGTPIPLTIHRFHSHLPPRSLCGQSPRTSRAPPGCSRHSRDESLLAAAASDAGTSFGVPAESETRGREWGRGSRVADRESGPPTLNPYQEVICQHQNTSLETVLYSDRIRCTCYNRAST